MSFEEISSSHHRLSHVTWQLRRCSSSIQRYIIPGRDHESCGTSLPLTFMSCRTLLIARHTFARDTCAPVRFGCEARDPPINFVISPGYHRARSSPAAIEQHVASHRYLYWYLWPLTRQDQRCPTRNWRSSTSRARSRVNYIRRALTSFRRYYSSEFAAEESA